LYLIEHSSLGHYTLCKGHVEADETEEETALREIKEETSLDVTIDTNFRRTITYSPYPNIIKDVVFFVAYSESKMKALDLHDDEVISSEWLPFEEAYNIVTFNSDKKVLTSANEYILSLKN